MGDPIGGAPSIGIDAGFRASLGEGVGRGVVLLLLLNALVTPLVV